MNTIATGVFTESTIYASVEQPNQRMLPVGLLPQHWCATCVEPTWVVTPEEAVEIAGLSPSHYCLRSSSLFDKTKPVELINLNPRRFNPITGKPLQLRPIHILTTANGLLLVCLKSLLLCLFAVADETAAPAKKTANASAVTKPQPGAIVTNVMVEYVENSPPRESKSRAVVANVESRSSRYESITTTDQPSDLNRLVHSHR